MPDLLVPDLDPATYERLRQAAADPGQVAGANGKATAIESGVWAAANRLRKKIAKVSGSSTADIRIQRLANMRARNQKAPCCRPWFQRRLIQPGEWWIVIRNRRTIILAIGGDRSSSLLLIVVGLLLFAQWHRLLRCIILILRPPRAQADRQAQDRNVKAVSHRFVTVRQWCPPVS